MLVVGSKTFICDEVSMVNFRNIYKWDAEISKDFIAGENVGVIYAEFASI